MNKGRYLFSQVLDFIDKYEFNKCVKRYFGDYHGRGCVVVFATGNDNSTVRYPANAIPDIFAVGQ